MIRRTVRGCVAGIAVLFATACGVSSEDEPQRIEDSSIQQPGATPSVDTEISPMPTSSTSATSPVPSSTIRPPTTSR